MSLTSTDLLWHPVSEWTGLMSKRIPAKIEEPFIVIKLQETKAQGTLTSLQLHSFTFSNM
ncbi:hypothetical protein E4U13_006846 [Claviceps humidiphila]|uniref:Uncharacterized protein n=1 Tax=Claviceps humidiphila TaxID=1294629 RepID=A0A9P7PUF1_9HYPO|nr:hypothetical protein E4U13_006846 [Claviceps humidiphila]